MVIVQEGITLDEFLRLPEEKPALEYFEGKVTQKVSPLGQHAALQIECAEHLNRLFRPERIARSFTELRSTHDNASLVPDVSLYRWDRIPRGPDGKIAAYFLEPPDVAIEIRSPGQTIPSLSTRCEWFVSHGALVALLVDHHDETIRVFRPGQSTRLHRAGDQITLDEIAAGTALDVAAIFAALLLD